jgi:hypothetical protein
MTTPRPGKSPRSSGWTVRRDPSSRWTGYVAQAKVSILVTPLLARRVESCLEALTTHSVAVLENGSPAV